MVLINEKHFACAACTRGHRVSGCTHKDRPLFEAKKKGRPSTQCSWCKESRQGSSLAGAVHNKCVCGGSQTPSVIMPASSKVQASSSQSGQYSSNQSLPHLSLSFNSDGRTDCHGRSISEATFIDGLKDVHEQVQVESSGIESYQPAERNEHLLNPCFCQTTGICICCKPKRERRSKRSDDTLKSLDSGRWPIMNIQPLAEVCEDMSSVEASGSSSRGSITSLQPPAIATNSVTHRNAQTRLYAPYPTPRHNPGPSVAITSSARPSSSLHALSDMISLPKRVSHQDEAIASDISRATLRLPEKSVFHAKAAKRGSQFEAMAVDTDDLVTLLNSDDAVFGACTCGSDCGCSGCLIHGSTVGGDQEHDHANCGSSRNLTSEPLHHLATSSGIASVQYLSSSAVANVSPSQSHHMITPISSPSSPAGKASSNAFAPSARLDHSSYLYLIPEADSSTFSSHISPPQVDSASRSRMSWESGRRANHIHSFSQPSQPLQFEPRFAISDGYSARLGHPPADFQAPTFTSTPIQSASADDGRQPPNFDLDAVNDDDASVSEGDLLAYTNLLTRSSARSLEVPSLPTSCSSDSADPLAPLQRQVQPSLGGNGTQKLRTDIGLHAGMNGMSSIGDFFFKLNRMSGGARNSAYQQMLQQTRSQYPVWDSPQGLSGLPYDQQQQQQQQVKPTEETLRDFAQVPSQSDDDKFQQQQQDTQHLGINVSTPNPNVIDLSKPLDAIQVEKILCALQKQDTSNQQNHFKQSTRHFQPQSSLQMPHLHSRPFLPYMAKPAGPSEEPGDSQMQQQDVIFDKYMLFPSPPAPDSTVQHAGCDLREMYGFIGSNDVLDLNDVPASTSQQRNYEVPTYSQDCASSTESIEFREMDRIWEANWDQAVTGDQS